MLGVPSLDARIRRLARALFQFMWMFKSRRKRRASEQASDRYSAGGCVEKIRMTDLGAPLARSVSSGSCVFFCWIELRRTSARARMSLLLGRRRHARLRLRSGRRIITTCWTGRARSLSLAENARFDVLLFCVHVCCCGKGGSSHESNCLGDVRRGRKTGRCVRETRRRGRPASGASC